MTFDCLERNHEDNNKKWTMINFGILYIFITPVKRCVKCVKDLMIVGKQMLLRSHCYLWSVEVFVQQLHCPQSLWVSSTEVNSSISCCQTLDLKELSAAGNILSHDETVLKGAAIDSRVWTCVHPPGPLQSFPRPLPYPVIYSSLSFWTQIWHMTSSPSLQVFSPAMETGPVWSHSKLLEVKKWWTLSRKLVNHTLDKLQNK